MPAQPIQIDGIPMLRRRFIGDLQSVWERRNVDPDSRGIARRAGTERVQNTTQDGQGITCYPGLSSLGLLDDSFQSLLETNFNGDVNWTINFHLRVGAPSFDSAATQDVTLFRWGGQTGETGFIELLLSVAPAPTPAIKIIAYMENTSTTQTLTYTFSSIPDPDKDVMVSLVRNSPGVNLYIDGSSEDSASFQPGIGASHWGEASLLGRSLRAKAAANVEPDGIYPTITDLGIWNTNLSAAALADIVGRRLNTTEQAAAGLKIYFPLTDDTENVQIDTKTSGRMFLAPSFPLIDTSNGAIFSGVSGYIRIPYSPLFNSLYSTRTEGSRGGAWSFQMRFKTPSVLEFPDGNATLAQFGPDGDLMLLEIVESGGNHNCKVSIGTSGGTETATSSKNLAADTSYLVTVSRETTALQLVVSDSGGTGIATNATIDQYGPDLDEGDVPEVNLGAAYSTSTESWSLRFRGEIKKVSFYNHAVPATSHALTNLDLASVVGALFAHDFTQAAGDTSPDLGMNGLNAFLESEDYSGVQVAPPFPAPGPIPDGEYVGAAAGVAGRETSVFMPTSSGSGTTVTGALRRPFGTDLQGVRAGNRALLLSNERVSLLDDNGQRLRPFGLPRPTGRPGIFPSTFGDLSGIAAYGITYVSREGTESPIHLLPPTVIRGATMSIGGGDNALGSKYGDTNINSGGTGTFWRYMDTYTGGGTDYSNFPAGTYTGEILARIDPDLNPDDWREHGFDRWIHNDAAFMLWGGEPVVNNGDIGNLNKPWTMQLFSRCENGSGASEEAIVCSIGVHERRPSTQAAPAGLVLTRDNTGQIILYTAVGTTIAAGWNRFATGWTPSTVDVDMFMVNEQGVLKFYSLENATTWTLQASVNYGGTGAIGGSKDANLIRLGAGYIVAEPTYGAGKTYVKQGANSGIVKWHLCRFWYDRAITPSMMDELSHTFLDPELAAAFSEKLVRDYKFASDDPFARSALFDCRVSSELMTFYFEEATPTTEPEEYEAPQGWDYSGRCSPILEWNKDIGLDTEYGDLGNAFAVIWSRIGNGSLIALSGKNLIYYAANDALVEQTPLLPADPQGLNWFTWIWQSIDGDTATPLLEVQSLWVNGQRMYSGAVQVDNHKSTFLAVIGGTNSLVGNYDDVHIYETRIWNSEKYQTPDDFEWLSRRIPAADWTDLVYYARFLETTGGQNDIPNDGTATEDLEEDGGGTVALVTVSTSPLPKPPWPDIIAIRLYRTVVTAVQDFADDRELDRLKRAIRGGPYYFLGAVGREADSFQDNIANDSLGMPARLSAGFTPRQSKGIAIWGGRPVIWGDGLNPLRLYVSDTLDFENFEADAYIHVPAREFEEIVACMEAGDAFYVFGYSGGLVYRGGDPSRALSAPVGGGIGAGGPRAIAAAGSALFVLGDAGLWAIQDQRRENIGFVVQDQLPSDTSQARLFIQGSSLFVLDESNGDCLRLHLPTGWWSIEDRNARSAASRAGTNYWVHRSGFLAQDAGYANDLPTAQSSTIGTVTGGSSTTLEDSTNPFHTGGQDLTGVYVRLVRDADGSTEEQEITSNTAGELTVASWDGVNPANGDTWMLGAYETLLDTGWIAGQTESTILRSLEIARRTGTWEMALAANNDPGDPDSDADLSYTAFTASGKLSADQAHRFFRAGVRTFRPEEAELVAVVASVEPAAGMEEISPDA